ncbi:6696_t:CDS:2 [Acaulospora morrowiae]|uniref:6696_t:CDS:1 n=1 Tax=Acaulospora morrowiae TaxID=94023 RepID=A0A9N9FVX2_9GLOM|nr:6696_t:CDS:2 [Acaulospora morrowiae]
MSSLLNLVARFNLLAVHTLRSKLLSLTLLRSRKKISVYNPHPLYTTSLPLHLSKFKIRNIGLLRASFAPASNEYVAIPLTEVTNFPQHYVLLHINDTYARFDVHKFECISDPRF